MSVKLLTEHHLKFLSLKGGCTGSSESTLVKIPHCWKSHIAAQICLPPFVPDLSSKIKCACLRQMIDLNLKKETTLNGSMNPRAVNSRNS